MVSVSQYPYFNYDENLLPLLEPLYNQSPLIFLGFKRCFPNLQLALVSLSSSKNMVCDIYSTEMYRYGYFPNNSENLQSGFFMWDHLKLGSSSNMISFMRDQHQFTHPLSIVQQHGEFCDLFIFGSKPGNSCINNFYLDKKELFIQFIASFYQTMTTTLLELSDHKITLPQDIITSVNPSLIFSPRQLECAELMTKGLTTKEIARKMNISPRTVNEYIDILRKKANAKNRAQLAYFLRNNKSLF
jgi:DNA-binding CsgD family transcriptional regulator